MSVNRVPPYPALPARERVPILSSSFTMGHRFFLQVTLLVTRAERVSNRSYHNQHLHL